jgi:hypothetical protein
VPDPELQRGQAVAPVTSMAALPSSTTAGYQASCAVGLGCRTGGEGQPARSSVGAADLGDVRGGGRGEDGLR